MPFQGFVLIEGKYVSKLKILQVRVLESTCVWFPVRKFMSTNFKLQMNFLKTEISLQGRLNLVALWFRRHVKQMDLGFTDK